MNRKIENSFIANYFLMFIISTMIALFAYMLLGFANNVISKTLIKNNYTAKSLMVDDYSKIDTASVVHNGGGVQVINSNYEIVLSAGINTILEKKLTVAEFTDFLIMSKSKGVQYSYSIEYNSKEKFWLIVTFPTSIRIDFAIVHNKDFASVDTQVVLAVILAVIILYIILLGISTIVYSKLTSINIINPLEKLCYGVARFKEGDYSSRVKLNLKNEFGELEFVFNEMADQIEKEIYLKRQSEENRKRLLLDISHDLKNPLASIMGYAELCYDNVDLTKEERLIYTKIIYENSIKANNLITDLFELSKMDSPEYSINKCRIEICEYMRSKIGSYIAILDKAEFIYDFNIPEKEIFVMIDGKQMDRVFDNLLANTIKCNQKGTQLTINLFEHENEIVIAFKDDGVGMPEKIAENIFLPFVRADNARNSQTGGTGLGLAIVEKIITLHGGKINLKTNENCGCEFIIIIPKI